MDNINHDQILVGLVIITVLIFLYCIFCTNCKCGNSKSNNESFINYEQETFMNYGGDDICNDKINRRVLKHVKIYNPDDINNSYRYNQSRLLSKNYYEIDEVCPELRFIYENLNSIKNETNLIKETDWARTKEHRYFMSKDYTKKPYIYPFVAFGVVVHDNCQRCPNIWRFLQKIPGLKLATLSMLAAEVNTGLK